MRILVLLSSLLVQGPAPPILTGSVTGHLRSDDGAPLAAIRVLAQDVPEQKPGVSILAGVTQTDSSGHFRLDDLPVGRYYLIAGPLDSPIYYPGVAILSKAAPVNVAVGVVHTDLDFVMIRPSSVNVRGRVVHEGSLPESKPPRAERVLLHGGQTRELSAKVAPDGSFDFGSVVSGDYTVGLSPAAVLTFPMNVAVDRDTSFELRVPATKDIAGKIVIDGGGPTPRFGVSFASANVVVNAAAALGAFHVALPFDRYDISLTGLPRGYTLKSVAGSSGELTVTEALSEVTVTLAVSSPPPWVNLSGRVSGISNGSGWFVVLTESAGSGNPFPPSLNRAETFPAPLNADGSFEFSKVLPGAYTVTLLPKGGPTGPDQAPPPTVSVVVVDKDLTDIRLPINGVPVDDLDTLLKAFRKQQDSADSTAPTDPLDEILKGFRRQ